MSKEHGTHLTMIRARARWNTAGSRSADNREAITQSRYDLPENVISLDRRRSMSVLDEFDIDDPIVPDGPSDEELRDLQILINSGQLDEMDLGDEYEVDLPEDDEYPYAGYEYETDYV